MLITTPLTGTETPAQVYAFLKTCIDFYQGNGTFETAAAGKWAGVRAAVNAILGPGAQIDNLELEATVREDLNRLNNLTLTLPTFMPSLLVWLDYGDVSTLFLDAARTTPATGAAGETIAGVACKSGRGNHSHQPTAASRPITANGANGNVLNFDGVADFMTSVSPINFAGSDKVTVTAAVRTASGVDGSRCIVEHGVNESNSFQLFAPRATGFPAGVIFGSRGSAGAFIQAGTDFGYPPPRSMRVTGQGDIGGDVARLRVDGTQIANLGTDQGTGGYGTHTLYVGSRSGSFFHFSGQIGSVMITNGFAAGNELRLIEAIVQRRMP